MAETQLEVTVEKFMKRFNNNSSIENAFAGFIHETKEEELARNKKERDAVVQLFSNFNEVNVAQACKLFAEHIYKEENSLKAQSLLSHFEYLVANNIILSRPLCEALLNSSSLSYSNVQIWCAVFQLIRRIIGGVDYKGCRDIFRAILYKCRTIPPSDSTTPQIQCVVEVFKYILNRNACLLPSYFAINEIIKLPQHDDKQPLHWAFGKVLAEFTQTFRPTAQIVTISGLPHLRPIIGHSNINAHVWRLELRNLRFPNSGPLPYDRDKSQIKLMRYILAHAYSVDFMTSMVMANRKSEDSRHRHAELEDQICDHIIDITDGQSQLGTCITTHSNLRWHNITAHIIFFVLLGMINLPHTFMQLYKKLEGKTFQMACARDHIMWMMMQCILGVGKMPGAYEYIAFVKLYDQLYGDSEPLPVPDASNAHSVISMAVTCIWVHLQRKSSQLGDHKSKPRPIPGILRPQLEFMKSSLPTYVQTSSSPTSLTCDFKFAALCNAYSTSETTMTSLMNYLTEALMKSEGQTTLLPHGVACHMTTEPLTMDMLDSLSVHSKTALIKHIFNKIDGHAKAGGQTALSPALLETCARVLVYTEIEQTYGIKSYVTNLLPSMMSSHCMPVVNGLLELATYRLSHMQPHYRMKILGAVLEELGSVHNSQQFTRYENTAAGLLLTLGNAEVQQQVYRSINEKKFSLVSHDSEELNRILILTLARAVNAVSDSGQAGSWCVSLLKKVFDHTPHNWSAHTLETFPSLISEFYTQNRIASDDRQQLQRNVDNEFQTWMSMADSDTAVNHFTRSATERPLLLCVLWKCIMTNTAIRLPAYKILENIGSKTLGLHLRTFCDYLATHLQSCPNKETFLLSIDAVRSMVWTYHLFTLDRFLLCLSLRTFDAKDAQVCLFAIQKLLTTGKFMDMVKDFAMNTPAQHWKTTKSYDHHMAYHKKNPESFFFEGMMESCGVQSGSGPSSQYLPTYFDNVCLRMLPVLDVVVHRLIEALNLGPTTEKQLVTILTDLSILYKFHNQPVTYLYHTLHYYHKSLKERTGIKKKLVHGILGCGEKLPLDLIVSADMKAYISSDQAWMPPADYFYLRVKRLADVISKDRVEDLCEIDWRFVEFTTAPSFVLYSTCAEFLALPVSGDVLGQQLIDVVFRWRYMIPKKSVTSWMNAVALLLTALPEAYYSVIFSCIIEEFADSQYLSSAEQPLCNPFEVFDVTKSDMSIKEFRCTYVLALTHIIWHHATSSQLSAIPKFVKEQIKPVVRTEQQFLFVCHMLGPFLPRFQQERAYSCIELTIDLYEILEIVDKAGAELRYMDTICDFFYHLKYMYVGDEPKLEVEKIIKNLRPALQLRLRFIAHHTTIDGAPIAPTPTN